MNTVGSLGHGSVLEIDQDFLIYLFQAFCCSRSSPSRALATLMARDMELNGGYAKERLWI